MAEVMRGAYLLRRGLFMRWELQAVIGADTARLGLRRLSPIRQTPAGEQLLSDRRA
jgi:hypothetical protein